MGYSPSVSSILATNPFVNANILSQQVNYYEKLTTGYSKGFVPFTNSSLNTNIGTFGTLTNQTFLIYDTDAYIKRLISTIDIPKFEMPKISLPSPATLTSKTSDTDANTVTNISNEDSELKPGLFKGRLAGQEATVTRICKKYGVSPALVASIIGLESDWGRSDLAMHNNFGGYRAKGDLGKNNKGFGYFSTIEKGLEAMIKNLAGYTRYSDVSSVDFANLDSIGKHYCEGNVWASRVRNVYNSTVKSYLA